MKRRRQRPPLFSTHPSNLLLQGGSTLFPIATVLGFFFPQLIQIHLTYLVIQTPLSLTFFAVA